MADDKQKTDQTNPEEEATESPIATEDEAAADTGQDEGEEKPFVEDPEFEVDYKGDCQYVVKVSIPAVNETKKTEELFDELKQEAEVPGFRRGRAPRKLLERKFGKAVKADVASKLASAAFEKLVEDKDLHPINEPDVEGLENLQDHPSGEPLTFTLSFEVEPRAELCEYEQVEIVKPVLKVDEEQVNESLNHIRSRMATYETVQDAAAEEGDQVVIDFEGKVDGEPFEGGTGQDYPYILGTQRFFPEFEEAITGAKAGEEKSCAVTLPDTMGNADLRGKEADFTITVKEIKRKQEPELTDEFAKEQGYEDLADMRAKVADSLKENLSEHTAGIVQERVLKALVENSGFELPKNLLERMTNHWYDNLYKNKDWGDVPNEERDKAEEELREEAAQRAAEDVKRMAVVEAIIKKEGLTVEEEDLEREAENMSRETGLSTDVITQYMLSQQDRGRLDSRILRNKALERVTARAKIEEKEMTFDELKQELDAEQEE